MGESCTERHLGAGDDGCGCVVCGHCFGIVSWFDLLVHDLLPPVGGMYDPSAASLLKEG